jgi:hypothetical protein
MQKLPDFTSALTGTAMQTVFPRPRRKLKCSCLSLPGNSLTILFFLDMEEKKQIEAGTDFCSGLIKTFCDRLEAAGYFAGFYTSTFFAGSVVTDAVRKRYCYWWRPVGRYLQL